MYFRSAPDSLFWKSSSMFHKNYRDRFLSYVRNRMDDPAIAAYRFARFSANSLLVPPDFETHVSYVEGIEFTPEGPRYQAWNQIDKSHMAFLSPYPYAKSREPVSKVIPLVICPAIKISFMMPFRSGFERRKRFVEFIWSELPELEDWELECYGLFGVKVKDQNWESEWTVNMCVFYSSF